jgi:hypothetical protein
MIITCSERVSVALGIQHAMCMRHTAICDLYGLNMFSKSSHKGYNFREKCVFSFLYSYNKTN